MKPAFKVHVGALASVEKCQKLKTNERKRLNAKVPQLENCQWTMCGAESCKNPIRDCWHWREAGQVIDIWLARCQLSTRVIWLWG